MEVYVVYQLGYTGSNVLEILGVFKNIDEAKKCYQKNIDDNINEYDYDFDKECRYASWSDTHNVTRLFKGGYQENWDNYLEIHIEKQEVK
ncbi:MAG: hypothetical protein ACI31S_01410 [Bacilli bacterium]